MTHYQTHHTYTRQCYVGYQITINPINYIEIEAGQVGSDTDGIKLIASGGEINGEDFLKLDRIKLLGSCTASRTYTEGPIVQLFDRLICQLPNAGFFWY